MGLGLEDFDLDRFKLAFLTTLPVPGRSSKNESELGSNLAEEEEEEENAEAAAGVESQL